MRRYGWVLITALLLVGACATGGEIGETTAPPSSIPPATAVAPSTSTMPSDTKPPETTTMPPTTVAPTTTTAAPPPWDEPPAMLVAGRDGAYLVEPGHAPVLVVDGPTSVAIGDGAGGVLFQRNSGRNWQSAEAWSTTVWWRPAGASTPVDLLVPSTGHDLTLVDAAEVDGHVTVYYVRSEGEEFASIDRLRSYDTVTRTITELFWGSAWEAGFGRIHVDGNVIALTVFGQIDSECAFIDLEGRPVTIPGDPSAAAPDVDDSDCVEPEDCPRACVVDPARDRLAYCFFTYESDESQWNTIVMVDTSTGEELNRFRVDPDQRLFDLELHDGWLIMNAWPFEPDGPAPAVLVSVNRPDEQWTLPMAGRATFVDD